ncbi:hypothetical protein K2X14_17270 [Acetobacter sp. TBRC 12305]|uniref:Uncharacterized protein n=1 Tax=Acetobacter garciniae TaxID=2817435 RepID=A0A939KPG0_9PROT|nr:hypothetical protein [Acetobacter garciniae]MBO1326845.1 hypothetical protein [Acetobacter garciniae]MBX0346571.1 hypothetical protein [Acetobacter garciniae]
MDTPKTALVARTVTATTAGISLPALAALLPQPYNVWVMWICIVFAAAGAAATQIPIPQNDTSRLWPLYRVLNFLALNWGKAANAAVLFREASTSRATPPGPGTGISPPDAPKS